MLLQKKGYGRILYNHTDSTGIPTGILFPFQPYFKTEEKEGVKKLSSSVRIKEKRRNGMVGSPLQTYGAWEGGWEGGKERKEKREEAVSGWKRWEA